MESLANPQPPPPPPPTDAHAPPLPPPTTSDPSHQQQPNIPNYPHLNHDSSSAINPYYPPPPAAPQPNPLDGLDPYAYAAQIHAQAYAAAIAPPNPSTLQELALQIAPPPSGVGLQRVNHQISRNKAPKVVKSVYCHVCNIDLNSETVLNNHKLGRKHVRNLEKLKESLKQNPLSQIKPSLPTVETKSEVGTKKKKTSAHGSPESLETKKRKLVEGGAAQVDMKVCTICNVVCNSEVVLADHLVGKKHLAMVKKQQAPTS